MKNKRLSIASSLLLFSMTIFVAPAARAQEAAPGDACSTVGQFMRSGGPEVSGAGYFLVCDGANWQRALEYDDNANVGIKQADPQAPLHVGGEVIVGNSGISCGASTAGAIRYTSATGGASYRNVFLVRSAGSGNLGGISGADSICQSAATSAGLTGDFDAWLATTSAATAPASRFDQSTVEYRLVDGTKIADDWADLVAGDSITNAICIEANGTNYCSGGSFRQVWTNVKGDGTRDSPSNNETCQSWTSNSGALNGFVGDYQATNDRWTYSALGTASSGCGSSGNALYCFQQEDVVGGTPATLQVCDGTDWKDITLQ